MRWITEKHNCPLCASHRRKILGKRGGQAHRDGLGVETNVVQCKNCRVLYTYPTLVPLSNPYKDTDAYFHSHNEEQKIEYVAKQILKAEEILGCKGKLLEIGCGRGEMLRAGLKLGWEVQGVEMTEEFAPKDLPIEIAKVEECDALLHEKYDLILLPAILEHLYQPVPVIRRIANALKPGGLLYIEVPNELSLAFKVGNLYVKPKGWSINLSPSFPPFHVVGFSPYSLEFLMRKAQLQVYHMETVTYRVALPGGTLKRDIERFAMKTLHKLGGWLGKGDGVEVWARKPFSVDPMREQQL